METLRILWFNWKCIKHPEAGGAERYTFEIAKRLVKMGHEVTIITSRPPGLPKQEIIYGINVIRTGTKFSVYLKAREVYKEQFRGKVNIVIDEVNTIPFFTITYVKEPIVALIHQLAREYWFYETPFPVSVIGYILEPRYLKLYCNIPTITVSESTKTDLESLGFRRVFIVPNGLNIKPLPNLPRKETEPTLIYLGRLTKAKRPDHVIKAFKYVSTYIQDAQLWIVGEGPLKKHLIQLARKLELNSKIHFFGKVSEKEKFDLLKRAWILVLPSIREGFGIVVIEANAMGTPVIAYNVPGIRDAVEHGKTGLLVRHQDHRALAYSIVKLVNNLHILHLMSNNALKWAKIFNWDNSTVKFYEVLKACIR